MGLPILASLLLVLGCASNEVVRSRTVFQDSTPASSPPTYRLGPGDELELYVHTMDACSTSSYRFQLGDQVDISVFSNPELNRQATVEPDGSVSLPFRGRLRALGVTADELARSFEKILEGTVRDPLVSVELVQWHQGARAVAAAMESGRQRVTVQVSPDGRLFLPFCDSLVVAGKTWGTVESLVVNSYATRYPGLAVSPTLTNAVNNKVYVLGEVRAPGAYALDGMTSLVQALARAQVSMDAAGLGSVLVVSRGAGDSTTATVVNVKRMLKDGNHLGAVPLHQLDVVFVPKKPIVHANLFVEQYINNMIPEAIRATIGYTLNANSQVILDPTPASTR